MSGILYRNKCQVSSVNLRGLSLSSRCHLRLIVGTQQQSSSQKCTHSHLYLPLERLGGPVVTMNILRVEARVWVFAI